MGGGGVKERQPYPKTQVYYNKNQNGNTTAHAASLQRKDRLLFGHTLTVRIRTNLLYITSATFLYELDLITGQNSAH